MELSPEIIEKVKRLEEKYKSTGQDLGSYLDGLFHADYLTYWDYIHLDTLLSLQKPKTLFPDEEIFIMYHQITELFFKLTLHEMKQIAAKKDIDIDFLSTRVKRINRYFEALSKSFEVMVEGMEREQFLTFRLSLQPASGFQSAQYRMIEIMATDFIRLVSKDVRNVYKNKNASIEEMFEHIYWKEGANQTTTGKKAYTVVQFEKKYSDQFIKLANDSMHSNLWQKLKSLPEKDQKDQNLLVQMRLLDINVNVNWPLMHYKSAVKYLIRKPHPIAATGGTNWQKYLPPRFQKRIFYPEIWTQKEIDEWGKSWVDRNVIEER